MKVLSLFAAGAMALMTGDLLAYQIVESRYHVETSPGTFVDQLILRCEDGRVITIPWQSNLAESCGEDLMGNVTTPPHAADAMSADEQQKQAMLKQLRSQYGKASEKHVDFVSGPGGLSTRLDPALVEVLKKYESCRKSSRDKAHCAAERDRAMAALPEREVPITEPAARAQMPVTEEPPSAPAVPIRAAAAAPPAEPVAEPAKTEMPAAPRETAVPAPAPAAAVPETRAAAAQKIETDYTGCMRAKPKYECDQSRARALSALDKPKPLKKPRKQAAAVPAKQAAINSSAPGDSR
jgi:hypothetical protein